MFDRVAPTYDLLNHFISLGQTTLWRVLALSWLHDVLPKNAKVLDVGCGTGWVTWYFRRQYPSRDLDIEGMDCSTVMLDEARRVVPGAEFTHGDVCALKHADGAFDAVTTVYTLRNFPDLRRGVEEMYRVTKPGGSVVILDAFPPSNAFVKSALYVWLELVMPVVAGLVTKRQKSIPLPERVDSVHRASRDGRRDAARRGRRGGGHQQVHVRRGREDRRHETDDRGVGILRVQ